MYKNIILALDLYMDVWYDLDTLKEDKNMVIVTAEEARDITKKNATKLTLAIKYVMEKILDEARHGRNKIIVYGQDCSAEVYEQIKSDAFFEFLKLQGYTVVRNIEEYHSHYYISLTISC